MFVILCSISGWWVGNKRKNGDSRFSLLLGLANLNYFLECVWAKAK